MRDCSLSILSCKETAFLHFKGGKKKFFNLYHSSESQCILQVANHSSSSAHVFNRLLCKVRPQNLEYIYTISEYLCFFPAICGKWQHFINSKDSFRVRSMFTFPSPSVVPFATYRCGHGSTFVHLFRPRAIQSFRRGVCCICHQLSICIVDPSKFTSCSLPASKLLVWLDMDTNRPSCIRST